MDSSSSNQQNLPSPCDVDFGSLSSSSNMDVDVPSSSSWTSFSDNYEVFLSFHGKDTGTTLTDHLYCALTERGALTFRRTEELMERDRETIMGLIDQAVTKSEVFIPVFSLSYATSEWCLYEIAKAFGMKKRIIPVFYHVSPSDVRKQSGPFTKSFEELVESLIHEKENLKAAMAAIGSYSGYHIKDHIPEGSTVKAIVENVMRLVDKGYADLEENFLGMDSRVQDVTALLEEKNQQPLMLGICGMGGLGKTTIAKTVYRRICGKFGFKCFLECVREKARKEDGLISLQRNLITSISKETCDNILDACQVTNKVKLALRNKRVLLVIDDIDEEEQISALGELEWFGSGSRIIVTTRNKRVFRHKTEKIYEPPLLDSSDSLKLFSYHAFGEDAPDTGYEEFSKNMVLMLQGLPLAVKVMGSHMFDKRTDEEWKEMTEKLKQAPDVKVEECLRVTIDGLEENVRQIFLDIATSFIGKHKREAMSMWDERKLWPNGAIKELQWKSLLKIDEFDRFEMHDIVRDIGRHIVSKNTPSNPQVEAPLDFSSFGISGFNRQILEQYVRRGEAATVAAFLRNFWF